MTKLPKENADLQRLIYRRMIPSLVLGAISTALFIGLECYTVIRFMGKVNGIVFSSILYFFVWLAAIFTFKVPERIKERSYEGEIVDIHVADRDISHYWFYAGSQHHGIRTIADLTIKDEKGKIRTYPYIVKGKLPVKVGSRIRRYAATDFLFLLDEGAPIVCINCGTHWDMKADDIAKREDAAYWGYEVKPSEHIPERCTFCRKTLIKRPPPKY